MLVGKIEKGDYFTVNNRCNCAMSLPREIIKKFHAFFKL